MVELAELVKSKTRSSSELVYRPLPMNDPTQRKPDISLAREKLDWQPTIELNEGLDRTIAYFKQLLDKKKLQQAA